MNAPTPLPFYRAFEDAYRGSRELIKARLQVYLPFIRPLQNLYGQCAAVDVGCGRGEWLELLLRHGFTPQGVDLDEGMLAICHELELPAVYGDAIVALQALPDASLTIVSGFHIAEHISFESLQQLVAEAHRVLKPAGLLILETPNAENLAVGTERFYLDPTHEKPIPYLLLSFLTEYAGFERNQLLRLQEEPALLHDDQPSLIDVIQGVSPDYAIVAQKKAPAWQMVLFDAVFEKEYGLDLATLGQRYQHGLQESFQRLSEDINVLQQQTEQLQAVLHSRSWRITKPLRQASELAQQWHPKCRNGVKNLFKKPLHLTMRFVLARPALRVLLNKWLQRHPALYSRLLRFARHRGLLSDVNAAHHNLCIPLKQPLSAEAELLYEQLEQALAHQQKQTVAQSSAHSSTRS